MTPRTLGALAALVFSFSASTRAGQAPRRVASLNLAADEILVEILPLERLVGVTHAADDPASSNIVGRVPRSVTRFFRADMERLVALDPDLVVVSEYTDADFLALLLRSGLAYHKLERLDSFAGYRQALLGLGAVVGELEAARRLVVRYDARLVELRKRLENVSAPRVLYWSNPFTAGAGTAIGALIECAGGRNAARELEATGLIPIGSERAFVLDPDVVLAARDAEGARGLSQHPLLSRMRAVREGRVVELPMRWLVTVSHHAAESCWQLARRLHPERFTEAEP
jgi:iron complex transport system substrate-binding protein